MKRADFEALVLPRLGPEARKAALRQLGEKPIPEKPDKKISRQKSVLVKAPIFCTRCGSYDHVSRLCLEAALESEFGTGKKQVFAVPVRTENEQNRTMGLHWNVKAGKRNLIRKAIGAAWKAAGITLRPVGYRVTITRLAPLVDPMNLDSCLKSAIDEVAARMGVDDASPLVEWVRRQEPRRPEHPAVRIEVEELP